MSDCGQAISCDALAGHVSWCTHVRKACIAGAVMIYAVCICTLLGLTTICLADGHGRGRQGLREMCTVGHKTAVGRPPTAAN